MASLTGSTIASTYDRLLALPSGGLNGSTLVAMTDGNASATASISITDNASGKAILSIDGSHASGTALYIDNSAGDGDVSVEWQLSGTTTWLMGIEDGDSDSLKICHDSTMGSDERLSFLTASTVFNEDSGDIDFRIESDDETHMIFIEGSSNRVSIGDSTDSPAATLEITNHASAGAYNVPLIQLNSNDTDQIALDINAANIDADVMDISADTVTTAKVIDISADALTSGSALYIDSDSSSTTARNIVNIIQNNSSASGAVALRIQQDSAADILNVFDGATEVFTILDGGNIGIGVTDPDETLEVSGDVKLSGNLYLYDTGGEYIASDGTDLTITSGTDILLSPGGKVGIGTTAPQSLLHVSGNVATTHSAEVTEDNDCTLQIHNRNGTDNNYSCLAFVMSSDGEGNPTYASSAIAGKHQDHSHGTINGSLHFHVTENDTMYQAMVITDSQRVGIGTTDPANPLAVNRSGDGTIVDFESADAVEGSVSISGSTTAFNTSSDYRLKENTVAMSDGLERLNQLKPYRFTFKAHPNVVKDGFFAHEVSDLVPEAVQGEKDGLDDDGNEAYQQIDTGKLIPIMVSAIQELSAKVEALENA